MYIFVEYEIQCSHRLPMVQPDHKCYRMHGHSYKIRLEVEGELTKQGWVISYERLKEMCDPTIEALDHQTLNDFMPNPTCEMLIQYLRERIPIATGIEIRETGRAGAGWRK